MRRVISTARRLRGIAAIVAVDVLILATFAAWLRYLWFGPPMP